MSKSFVEFVTRLKASELRHKKFLYFYAFFLTPMTFLNLIPLPKSNLSIAIQVVYFLAIIVSVIIALFKLAPHFNRVLRFSGGLTLPGKRVMKSAFWFLRVLFFVWLSGLTTVIMAWTFPQVLQSETFKPGGALIGASIIAAPLEEIWRWAVILCIFYIGVEIFGERHSSRIFGVAVVVSCLLFGMGHIGQLQGYGFVTWLMLSLSGLFLVLYAYFARSFWTAVFAHGAYDLLVSTGLPHIAVVLWWPSVVALWIIIGWFYVRWRRAKVTDSQAVPRPT